ncbi:MAG TPA: hypothetical protein VI542_11620 [Candidatus Tectomicrobia bacterium]
MDSQSDVPKRSNDEQRLLSQLKDHIVQIEAMIVYLLICIIVLYVLDSMTESGELRIPLWLIPSIFLVGLRPIMRVNNPTAPIRKALTWAATLGGWGGAIVGAAADILTGGLTAGQGTLIGIAAGSALGGTLGNWIEGWGAANDLIERGAAFDHLYSYRKKNPKVANPNLVNKALDEKIPSFDKNADSRKWYALDDLRCSSANTLRI